jgi:hypothetical protein
MHDHCADSTDTQSPPRLEDIVDRVNNTNVEHVMFEPTAKRERAILDGVTVADSTNVVIMHEPGRLAVYYFPIHRQVATARATRHSPRGHRPPTTAKRRQREPACGRR